VKKSKWGIYSLAMGAFALAIIGCGGKTETSEAPAPAASAAASKTVDAATAGEVTGSVKLDGAAPKMKTISMAAEPACTKGHTGPVTSEEVVTEMAARSPTWWCTSSLAGWIFISGPHDARKI